MRVQAGHAFMQNVLHLTAVVHAVADDDGIWVVLLGLSASLGIGDRYVIKSSFGHRSGFKCAQLT